MRKSIIFFDLSTKSTKLFYRLMLHSERFLRIKTKAKLPFDSPAGMILLAIILKLTFNVLTLCTVHR